jgi:hypothetical protein
LDANHNGRLSRDEVRSDAEVAEQFPRLDRDGDGTWNQQELISWCGRSRAGEISLGQLVELASQGLQLDRGDVRLIGWTDQPMPGIAIRPRSAQETRRTMFVVHLRRGPLPAPRPDINCEADVREIETERPTEQGLPKAVPEPSPIGSPPSSAAATPGP